MDSTDGELLQRWRHRDNASGEALFERYYAKVERFFLNKVADAAPDLVQETFARCVAGRDQIRDNEHFRLYLFGIAYNVLKDHLRRRYRGEAPLDLEQVSIRDMEPGPATAAGQRREHRMLLEALRSIPIDDQVMLELHYWDSLKTEQIAEALGIPVGTARGRLQRARTKLTEAMARFGDGAHDLTTTLSCIDDWARECRDHVTDARR